MLLRGLEAIDDIVYGEVGARNEEVIFEVVNDILQDIDIAVDTVRDEERVGVVIKWTLRDWVPLTRQ